MKDGIDNQVITRKHWAITRKDYLETSRFGHKNEKLTTDLFGRKPHIHNMERRIQTQGFFFLLLFSVKLTTKFYENWLTVPVDLLNLSERFEIQPRRFYSMQSFFFLFFFGGINWDITASRKPQAKTNGKLLSCLIPGRIYQNMAVKSKFQVPEEVQQYFKVSMQNCKMKIKVRM